MVESKEFIHKGEPYKAILFKYPKKQIGQFIVIKYPILLDTGTHQKANKAYKIDVLMSSNTSLDSLIADFKDKMKKSAK